MIGNRSERIKNLFERTSSNWVRYSEYEWGGRGRNSVSHAHQNGATEYLRSTGRVSENCIGFHQHRTHGYKQKAGCRNSEGYPAFCGEIQLLWTDDCRCLPHQTLWNMKRSTCRKITSPKKKLCPLKNIWNCSLHLTNWM